MPKKEAFYSFDGSSGKAQVVNRMGDLENGTNTGEMIKRWDKIDTIFKDAGYTIEFTEALTYVVMLESIQEEIVADLLQEARQKNPDSTLCHGLERAYEKVKHPYLSVTENILRWEGLSLLQIRSRMGL